LSRSHSSSIGPLAWVAGLRRLNLGRFRSQYIRQGGALPADAAALEYEVVYLQQEQPAETGEEAGPPAPNVGQLARQNCGSGGGDCERWLVATMNSWTHRR